MRHLILIVVFLGALVLPAVGQVIINPVLASPGTMIKPQLWNFSLINSSGQAKMVRIEMTMSDRATNQLVLSGVSRLFSLTAGASQAGLTELLPISYQHVNPTYQVDQTPDGFLPVGVFNICYKVVEQINDGLDELTENCETVEIEPISPPQLMIPEDSGRIQLDRPVFTWTPPMPYHFFSSLTYDISVVEVGAHQTAATAIQENIPLFRQANVRTSQVQYPSSIAALDTSKLYAWRIVAKNNTLTIAESEIWTFKVVNDRQAPAKLPNVQYVKLTSNESNVFAVAKGALHFEFSNRDNVPEIQLQVFASERKKALLQQPLRRSVQFGQNFKDLDLGLVKGLQDNQFYVLQVDAGGMRSYLKFQYRKP